VTGKKEGRPRQEGAPQNSTGGPDASTRPGDHLQPIVVTDPDHPAVVVSNFIDAMRLLGGAATVEQLRSIIARGYPWRRRAAARRIAAAIEWGCDAGLIGAAWREDGELVVYVVEDEAVMA
jgi:hypothetical protein